MLLNLENVANFVELLPVYCRKFPGLRLDFFRDAIDVQSGKNQEKIRENNEHMVPRPFTSNNNEQIEKPTKLEDKLESIIER